MKRIACRLLALVVLPGAAPGDVDEATRTAFLKEYAAASARILPVYEQIRIEGKLTHNQSVQSWTYARSGASTRSVFRLVDPDTDRGASVIVADPQHSFKLSRDPKADAYRVISQARAPGAAITSYVTSTEVRTLPAFAPYRAYLERPVAEFLADQGCTIQAIARIGAAPDRIVRVDWEMAAANPKDKDRYGTFEFLPDAGWVLKSYSIYSVGAFEDPATGETFDFGRGGDLDYRGEHASVPLVQRVATWTSLKGRGEGPTYEVTRIVPGPVPKSEFAIESFPIAPPPAPAAQP